MPDYTKNMEAMLSGHTGDVTAPHAVRTPGKLEQSADVRDMLSILVGAGKGGLKPDDQAAVISQLKATLGAPTANKLINHVAVFNERSDVGAKTAQQRVGQFYDMGSRDPEVDAIIKQTSQLAQGPIAGMGQTADVTLKALNAGQNPKLANAPNSGNVAQVQSASGGF